MSGEWQDVGTPAARSAPDADLGAVHPEVASFLASAGLASHAQRIVDVTGAGSLDDLRLIDAAMLEDVVKAADLKLVVAKKFRMALAELRGEPSGSAATPQTPAASGHSAAGRPGGERAVAPEGSGAAPQECIAVCIDRSGSMGSPFSEITLNVVRGAVAERTRMEAVKAMFYAFRDRVESVGCGTHHLGLVQFDDRVERLLDLNPHLHLFETIVDDVEKRGRTAIYSAILEAASMLEPHFSEDSPIDLRVLVLTDGVSNAGAPPEEALAAVNRIGAVVDAIIVGSSPDSNLRRIVSATGGECYQIGDLGEGFELLEAEGVVSLEARRGGLAKPPFQERQVIEFAQASEKTMTRGAAVKRAPAPQKDCVSRKVVDASSMNDLGAAMGAASSAWAKRVLKELKQVVSGEAAVWLHSRAGVHVFPSPDALNFWRALIEGPEESPFEGGVFALTVVIPDTYPLQPPSIVLETPIYHCNVSDSGKLCLDILKEQWSPALTIPKCLEAVRQMMKKPDPDNSLRQWIAELTLAHNQSNGADTRYFEKAREHTRQHASLTVDEWKQKWGC